MNTRFKTSLRPLLLMGLAGFLTLLVNRYSEIDAEIANLFFDANRQLFPLKDVRWLSAVFHDGLKYLSTAIWLGLFLKMLLLTFSKKELNAVERSRTNNVIFNYRYVLLASLLAGVITTYLKLKSSYACPWGLSMYGGNAPHLRLFDSIPTLAEGFEPGKCFPSGHASVGFMWLSLLMLKEPVGFFKKPVLMGFVTAMCVLAGGVQIIRGAHFLSHVMATGVLCWFVVWFTYEVMIRLKKPSAQ